MIRRFEFPVKVVKAYIDENTKKRHLIAVASDDQIDYYLERFTRTALDDMVFYANEKKELKSEEGLVGLLETHWSTFEFGFVVEGWVNRNIENSSWEFYVDLELKDTYPQSNELYEDVKRGVADKQLSVGGYIENWEEDTEWDEVEVDIDEDDNPIKILIKLLKHFVLEHIATTPADGAANPRTRFETAEYKSLGFVGQIYKSLSSDEYQEDYARIQKEMISRKSNATKIEKKEDKKVDKSTEEEENSFLNRICKFVEKTVNKLFDEREDRMDKIEKAKELAEKFKSLMEDKETFTDEVREDILKMFVPETPDKDDKEDKINFEEVAKSVADKSVEDAMTPLQTTLKDLTDRMDGVNPEIELVRKSIEDLKEELTKATKALSGLEKLDERIKSLEDNVDESHQIPKKKNSEPDETKVNKDLNPIYSVWNEDEEEEDE